MVALAAKPARQANVGKEKPAIRNGKGHLPDILGDCLGQLGKLGRTLQKVDYALAEADAGLLVVERLGRGGQRLDHQLLSLELADSAPVTADKVLDGASDGGVARAGAQDSARALAAPPAEASSWKQVRKQGAMVQQLRHRRCGLSALFLRGDAERKVEGPRSCDFVVVKKKRKGEQAKRREGKGESLSQ